MCRFLRGWGMTIKEVVGTFGTMGNMGTSPWKEMSEMPKMPEVPSICFRPFVCLSLPFSVLSLYGG